jgi:hypothetical protein
VLLHPIEGETERLGELADRRRSASEALEDAPAGRVRESAQDVRSRVEGEPAIVEGEVAVGDERGGAGRLGKRRTLTRERPCYLTCK